MKSSCSTKKEDLFNPRAQNKSQKKKREKLFKLSILFFKMKHWQNSAALSIKDRFRIPRLRFVGPISAMENSRILRGKMQEVKIVTTVIN